MRRTNSASSSLTGMSRTSSTYHHHNRRHNPTNNNKKPKSQIVTIDLTNHKPKTPLGMLLAPNILSSTNTTTTTTQDAIPTTEEEDDDDDEPPTPSSDLCKVVIVAGWERLSSSSSTGKLGPIQRCGTVRLGDRLVEVNGRSVRDMTFRDVMDLLRVLMYEDGDDEEEDDGVKRRRGSSSRRDHDRPRLVSLGFEPFSSSNSSDDDGVGDPLILGTQAPPSPLTTRRRTQDLCEFTCSIRRARIQRVVIPRGNVNENNNNNNNNNEEDNHNNVDSASSSNDDDDDASTMSICTGLHPSQWRQQQQQRQEEESSGLWEWLGQKYRKRNPRLEEFVEYEICCRLVVRYPGSVPLFRIGGDGGGKVVVGSAGSGGLRGVGKKPEEVTTWNVWKRYSEFKALDMKLRSSHGWRLDTLNNGQGLLFPPIRLVSSILVGNVDPSFVEWRRLELIRYWQCLQRVDEIFDFANPNSRRFSEDLVSFLEFDKHFSRHRNNNNNITHTTTTSSRIIRRNGGLKRNKSISSSSSLLFAPDDSSNNNLDHNDDSYTGLLVPSSSTHLEQDDHSDNDGDDEMQVSATLTSRPSEEEGSLVAQQQQQQQKDSWDRESEDGHGMSSTCSHLVSLDEEQDEKEQDKNGIVHDDLYVSRRKSRRRRKKRINRAAKPAFQRQLLDP